MRWLTFLVMAGLIWGTVSRLKADTTTVFGEPGRGRVAVQVIGDVSRSGVTLYVVNDARLSEVLLRAGWVARANHSISIRRKGENGRVWRFKFQEHDIRFDFAAGDLVMVAETYF